MEKDGDQRAAAFAYYLLLALLPMALLPVAAGTLYPLTATLLSPMIAGAAMSFSSLSVILNALRLREAL